MGFLFFTVFAEKTSIIMKGQLWGALRVPPVPRSYMHVSSGPFIFLFLKGGDMYIIVQQKRYGFWKFLGDIFMIFITWGLWLVWIFVREMRRRSSYLGG